METKLLNILHNHPTSEVTFKLNSVSALVSFFIKKFIGIGKGKYDSSLKQKILLYDIANDDN
jgi:hypothetical protein